MRNIFLSIAALAAIALGAGSAKAQYYGTWVTPYSSGYYYSNPLYTGYYGYYYPGYYYGGYYYNPGYYRPGVYINTYPYWGYRDWRW